MRSRMRSTGEAAYLISLYLLFHLPPTFVRRQRFDSFIILPIEEKEEYDRRNKQEESSPSDNKYGYKEVRRVSLYLSD